MRNPHQKKEREKHHRDKIQANCACRTRGHMKIALCRENTTQCITEIQQYFTERRSSQNNSCTQIEHKYQLIFMQKIKSPAYVLA